MTRQLALIEAESDEALLLSPGERRKRYTAAQAEQIAWKLECILAMVATGVMPLDTIAQRAHVNFRVVQELCQRHAEAIGRDALKFAEYAAGKSGKFLLLADQKAGEASFRDLMIGHGIARDTAINLRAAGPNQLPEETAIDVETDDPRRAAFVERLKQLKPV